ncbi:unnamed protein product, partial [Heterotrigona itama]
KKKNKKFETWYVYTNSNIFIFASHAPLGDRGGLWVTDVLPVCARQSGNRVQ